VPVDGQYAGGLKRSISLPFLIFYGLGTMIGGGIYALTGKIAGVAGFYAPTAFALSALLAMVTAFSYAELAARFPFSAGEVRYVSAAFARKKFAALIGWLIVFTGIVSAAALANATAGFIQDFADWPLLAVSVAIVLILGCVAAWGITESVAVITIITLIEVAGLMLVIATGWPDLATLGSRWPEFVPPVNFYELAVWGTVFSGAVLAFYAFIGFEDMVNVAEEVKDVRHTMPLAIIICIVLTLIIYVLVSLVAVMAVPPAELAQSNTPMAMIMQAHNAAIPPYLMGAISLLATVNGVLVQMIMGTRVLYGMAKTEKAPGIFSHINAHTRTPLYATAFVVVAVLVFTLLSDLTTLAKAASMIILFVFTAVNAALLKLKWAGEARPDHVFTVPFFVPLAGMLISAAMLVFSLWNMIVL